VFDKRKRDSLVLVVVVVGKGKSEVTLTGEHTQTRRDIEALHIIFLGDLINFFIIYKFIFTIDSVHFIIEFIRSIYRISFDLIVSLIDSMVKMSL
jgi:hypothetical protein